MRRVVSSVISSMALVASTSTALHDAFRQEALARFIASRQAFDLTCLYTFDRFRPSVNVSISSEYNGTSQDAADDQLLVTIPPMFEEHVGRNCPFGDLQFDPELVTSLDDGNSTRQLGVHLSEDPHHDVKRPQIASNDVVPAKEFFMSATQSHGFSFEFSYRRRVETNQTMTLFSIGNRFGSCVDPGFRVDLISTHVIMLIYFYPVLMGNDIACYERRLFSAWINRCAMPRYRPIVDENPVVHVIVTLDTTNGPSDLRSGFFLKYVDPVTMETFECRGSDGVKSPDPIEYEYVQGTYRLYLGNNPRNVSNPLKRSRIAPVRQYRDPDWDDRPAEERLRDMIKQKLDGIVGPRVPASFRIFGGKGVSMSLLGIPMPPINEDTPFKWMRNAIDDFKKDHGNDVVEFIIKSLREGEKKTDYGFNSTNVENQDGGKGQDSGGVSNTSTPTQRGVYPNANGSTFDIFHFAVYNQPVSPGQAKETFWSTWMTPFRPFMELKRTVRIHEDEEVLLELLQLHSIFDDIKLEIVQLPERGTVKTYPNRTILTRANIQSFRELPAEQQQNIYFMPNPRENNINIKGGGLGRQFDPYSVIRFRVWKSTVGRNVNSTREGVIEIWVDPVDNVPSSTSDTEVKVHGDDPVYLDLAGHETSFQMSGYKPRDNKSRQLGLFDGLDLLGARNATTQSPIANQSIRIIDLPRFGLLYDRRMENVTEHLRSADAFDPNELEPYRIRREWIANKTFSTSLVYLPGIWKDETIDVDFLRYQLHVGSSSVYSALSTVKFLIRSSVASSDASLGNGSVLVRVQEDSAITITLLQLESFVHDSGVQFKLGQLPIHGKLYQYQDVETLDQMSSLNTTKSIGSLIQSEDTIVADVSGRLVYVPDPDYLNSVPYELQHPTSAEALDLFRYSVLQDDLFDSMDHRTVQLRVLNTPDELRILPPTVITTDRSRGEFVPVPVLFDDPDGFAGRYRVIFEAKDDATIEFGHAVTDDDILKYCPFERPCTLIRSANESYVSNENGDNDEAIEWRLLYTVRSRTWNPSKIEVEGSKAAIEYSLRKLKFRDLSKWTWYSDHTARFDVEIERLGSTQVPKVRMAYYVDFVTGPGNDINDSLVQALSDLADLIALVVWIVVVCFVLSSASCFSIGFCCCCARARREKRRRFEENRRRYIDQVAQNNHEYSSLLKMFVNILEDTDVLFVMNLLRICGGSHESQRSILQVLCLKSITPILDADDYFSNLVTNLLRIECRDHTPTNLHVLLKYPSPASLALTQYCNEKGGQWLRRVRHSILSTDDSEHSNETTQLIVALEYAANDLPAEIVDMCQKFASVVSTTNDADATLAVHIVFFNHFVGPELWFGKWDTNGKRLSRSRLHKLRESVRVLASYGWNQHATELRSPVHKGFAARYKKLLQDISTSQAIHYRTGGRVEMDGNIMGACLMNLHSILDRVLPALEKDEKARLRSQEYADLSRRSDEDVSGELDISTMNEVKRLLYALNFPLTYCEALSANADAVFASDPLLWNGFSIDEWQDRVQAGCQTTPKSKPPTLRHGESLLSVDISHEEDVSSTVFASSRSDPSSRDDFARMEFEF